MADTNQCPECGSLIPDGAPLGQCPQCLIKAGLDSEVSLPLEFQATTSNPAPSGFVPPTVEELGPLFPRLEMLELIGAGGMGAVYKARQRELDRLVAVKILPPEVGGEPAFAERFGREARALAKLSHPNIVGVYDSGQVEGLYYFVMEYVEGDNLRQAMQANQIQPDQVLALVQQVCESLQYAHDEGIIHRDIKPENVLLDAKGRVKIADFGLAKLLSRDAGERSLTHTHQVMGTFYYMAPEQMQGSADIDHRADIYSLGVLLYELLTGEVPMGRFEPPSHRVQIDVRLDEIVLRSLEREPARRYQAVSDVRSELETVSKSEQPVANSPVLTSRQPQESESNERFITSCANCGRLSTRQRVAPHSRRRTSAQHRLGPRSDCDDAKHGQDSSPRCRGGVAQRPRRRGRRLARSTRSAQSAALLPKRGLARDNGSRNDVVETLPTRANPRSQTRRRIPRSVHPRRALVSDFAS